MIEIRCCHNLMDAATLRQEINAVNLASVRPDPFSTFEFYENFLRHGEWPAGIKSPRLWLLLAFRDGELIGYAALKRSVHWVLGLRAAKLDWLTAYAVDRPHVVARSGQAGPVAAALYAYLLERKQEWSLLEFQQQEPGSPLRPPTTTAAGALRFRDWPNMANGTIPIRWNSTAEYFAALSKKARSNVSRQMRTLMAAGEVQVLTSSDPRVLPALFELYRGIEPHSWKAQANAAIGRNRQSVAYHTGLMDPAQPMRLVIQLLLLDGRPIGGLICGAYGRGLYALHIVYDERQARLAPGSAILLMGVRLAIEGRYDFFNLLHGFGYYKERWLAEMSEFRSLQVYRIATPFFWRRVLGDAMRRCLGRAEKPAALLFNPARRDPASPGTEAAAPAVDPGERVRHAALVERALRGSGEFLSALQLAAVLPFETQRKAGPIGSSVRQPTDGAVTLA